MSTNTNGPTPEQSAYYRIRGCDDSRMRVTFTLVFGQREQARVADNWDDYAFATSKADAAEAAFLRDGDEDEYWNWLFLRTATEVWRRWPEEARRRFDDMRSLVDEFGFVAAGDPRIPGGIEITPSQLASMFQARELTGHGEWPVPAQPEAGGAA